mmetsp:Transcript_28745/g.82984  ORF Transcript_28745/g.82984 Transcript_28745/m.82984 type:complete len:863 (-) Transcript_28745:1320-3908(-)
MDLSGLMDGRLQCLQHLREATEEALRNIPAGSAADLSTWRDLLAQICSSLAVRRELLATLSHLLRSTDTDSKSRELSDAVRQQGNEAFKGDAQDKAIYYYTEALKTAPTDDAAAVVLTNRSLIFLRVDCPWLALTDGIAAVARLPTHVKAWFRIKKAMDALGADKGEEGKAAMREVDRLAMDGGSDDDRLRVAKLLGDMLSEVTDEGFARGWPFDEIDKRDVCQPVGWSVEDEPSRGLHVVSDQDAALSCRREVMQEQPTSLALSLYYFRSLDEQLADAAESPGWREKLPPSCARCAGCLARICDTYTASDGGAPLTDGDPLVACLRKMLRTKCAVPLTVPCSTCRRVIFCSPRCRDDSSHVLLCRQPSSKRQGEGFVPRPASVSHLNGYRLLTPRAVVAACELIRQGEDSWRGERSLESLVCHLPSSSDSVSVACVVEDVVGALFWTAVWCDWGEGEMTSIDDQVLDRMAVVMQAIARIRCNAFGVSTCNEAGDHCVFGTAFYPRASYMNHSCSPNAIVSFYGTSIRVCLCRDVRAGEEITITYGPLCGKSPSADRHKVLKRDYGFECVCPSCVASPPSPVPLSDWLYMTPCPSCHQPSAHRDVLRACGVMTTAKGWKERLTTVEKIGRRIHDQGQSVAATGGDHQVTQSLLASLGHSVTTADDGAQRCLHCGWQGHARDSSGKAQMKAARERVKTALHRHLYAAPRPAARELIDAMKGCVDALWRWKGPLHRDMGREADENAQFLHGDGEHLAAFERCLASIAVLAVHYPLGSSQPEVLVEMLKAGELSMARMTSLDGITDANELHHHCDERLRLLYHSSHPLCERAAWLSKSTDRIRANIDADPLRMPPIFDPGRHTPW